MKETKLAWMVGVFEGEGTIYIARNTGNPSVNHCLYLEMSNTDRELLLPLRNRFGGSVLEIFPVGGTQRAWVWGLRAKQAASALEDMLPYMAGRKGRQAKAAIEFQEHKEHLGRGDINKEEELAWREACKQYIAELGRGEPVSS